jgi:hypothetical protein
MALYFDFGTVFALSGVGGVTNVLQTSQFINGTAASFVKFKVNITTDASSTMTAVAIKTVGLWTFGGSDVVDIISYKLDTNTGQPELSHSYSGLTTGQNLNFCFQAKDLNGLKGGFGVAVVGTFSSGTSRAGDSVTISALGW